MSYQRLECLEKDKIFHGPTIFCSLLVENKPTWLHPEKLKCYPNYFLKTNLVVYKHMVESNLISLLNILLYLTYFPFFLYRQWTVSTLVRILAMDPTWFCGLLGDQVGGQRSGCFCRCQVWGAFSILFTQTPLSPMLTQTPSVPVVCDLMLSTP